MLFGLIVFELMNFPVLGKIVFTALIGFLMALIAWVITGQNEWVKWIQGEGIGLMGFDSTGVMPFVTVKTVDNKYGGIDVVIPQKNGTKKFLAYDKDMVFRVFLAPFKIFMKPKDTPEGLQLDLLTSIPAKQFDSCNWRQEKRTMLFYNKELGTLINRFQVNEMEKWAFAKYPAIDLARKFEKCADALEQATRGFIINLMNSLGAFLGSPIFKILMIVLVGGVLIVAGYMFLPNLMNMLTPVAQQAGPTAGGAIKAITTGGVSP